MEHKWENYFDTKSEYWAKLQKIYEENEHYPKVVVSNRNLHHKFMRSFSRLEGVEIDNDKDNLVSLSFGDHFLAHYYLWKCTKKGYKKRTAAPVIFMYRKCFKSLNEETAIMIAKSYDELKHCTSKISKDGREKIRKSKKGVPRSEETKRKCSEHSAMKLHPELRVEHAEFMKGNQFHNKKVQCIETGIIYESGKEAAIKNNCSLSIISLACRGIYKTAKGYHWRYV